MNRRSGYWIALLLILALAVSACSPGGGSSEPASTGDPAGQDNPATDTPQQAGNIPADYEYIVPTETKGPPPLPNYLPLVTSPKSISWFVPLDARVSATKKSYAEIEAFKVFEQETGITIDFHHPPSGMENEQFNLMLASGELTDIITYGWPSFPGGPEKAIQDGVIIPLNDLIAEHAPNFTRFLEDNPDIKKEIMTDNGTIYMFPLTRQEKWLRYVYGLQLRKDWLDKLGLEVPTTIDEWYIVLKAFKEQDPSGTGKIIPFGNESTSPNFSELPLTTFMSGWGIPYNFYQVDGKVGFGPYTPEYKEYLETMHQWYQEGLIDPDFAATNRQQFDAKVTGHQLASFGALLNGGMGRLSDLMKDDPSFELVGAQVPKAKDGNMYNFHKDASRGSVGGGNAVSGTSKNAADAVRWMDVTGFSAWGHMLFNFGIEGESYEWVDGYPKYTDKVLNDPNLPVVNAIQQYALSSGTGRFFNQDGRYFEQMLTHPQQKAASLLWAEASTERQLPPVTATPEEATQLASITTEVFTYTDEMFVKFITGAEPLSNFDTYIERLKQMGIEEAIAINQAALERYNSR